MKILAVRVGRAGDVVMVTPALAAILKLYPHAELHLLTGPDGTRVLKGYDARLTEVMVYDRKKMFGFVARSKIAGRIAREGYSHIYCFELNPGYYRLFRKSAAQLHAIDRAHEELNYSERCLRVVQQGHEGEVENEWVNLPVSEQGRERAEALLRDAGIGADDFVIAMHPSFSGLRKARFRSKKAHYLRQWPVESFARLAQLLVEYMENMGMPVKVIMDLLPDERELGESIVAASGGCITLLTPPPDFERYKAVIRRADLLITPNTGPMHIGGAVGTHMVALFSGMSPADCGPYVPAEQYVALCAEDTTSPERGIAAITPQAVFDACRSFLPDRRES